MFLVLQIHVSKAAGNTDYLAVESPILVYSPCGLMRKCYWLSCSCTDFQYLYKHATRSKYMKALAPYVYNCIIRKSGDGATPRNKSRLKGILSEYYFLRQECVVLCDALPGLNVCLFPSVAESCLPTEFPCGGSQGGCVPKEMMCNGRNDCENGRDESASSGCIGQHIGEKVYQLLLRKYFFI